MLVAKHPDVLEVAAVPVASELGEDDVMVYIVLQPDAKSSHAEIIQFCSKNMAYFMVPRYVHFIDALPKTASEKIEKYKLKSYAEENKSKLWDRDAAGIVVSR